MTPIRSLLVDDFNPLRRIMAAALADEPDFLVVGEAADGLEAIDKARRLQPDLIVMDMSMPRCNGLEATRRIKQELPNTVIILFTGRPTDHRVALACAEGARGCLDKGAELKQTLYTLRRLVMTDQN